jgi:hypothetical protein
MIQPPQLSAMADSERTTRFWLWLIRTVGVIAPRRRLRVDMRGVMQTGLSGVGLRTRISTLPQ